MRAKKVAISLSADAVEAVDRYAKAEGISRSAWFERAAQRAKRHEGTRLAVRQAVEQGLKRATEKELESLRKELSRGR